MNTQEDKTNDIWEIIKSNKTAMLTTCTEEGLRGRPVHIVQDTYEGTICFLAPSNSDPVEEVAENSEVGISFMNDVTGNYLFLTGRGQVSNDMRLKNELWSEDVAWLFPEGTTCDGVSVIEINIRKGESWRKKDGSTTIYERFYAFVQSEKSASGSQADLF